MKTWIASALIVLSNGLAWAQAVSEPPPETAFTTPIIFPERSQGAGMAVDSARNAHALALRVGKNFSLQVVKLSPQGNILWSRNLPGTPNAFNGTSFLFPGNPGIAVDGSGNSYVAATDLFGAGGVVFKVDADGNVTGPVQVPLPGLFPALTGVAFDAASGHLYVAGTFIRPGTLSSPAVGSVLAAEYGPDLARLNTALIDDGPAAFDASGPIAADGSGNVYVGVTQEGVFPNRDNSWLVAKFTPHLGQRLPSSPFLTDRFFKFLRGLAAGPAGSVYAVGERDTAFTTVGSIARLDGAGGVMVFPPFQSPGTNPFDFFSNVKADAAGNAYVAGFSCAGAPKDCFTRTLKYSPAGEILWKVQLPGDFFTDYGIDVDGQKGVYLAAGGRPDALAIKYQQAGANIKLDINLNPPQVNPVGTVTLPVGTNVTTIEVKATDSMGPVANQAISFRAEGVPTSGGHDHRVVDLANFPRPTGRFGPQLTPTGSCTTDSLGRCAVAYQASGIGGQESIVASVGSVEARQTLQVSVPFLEALGAGAEWELVGNTGNISPPVRCSGQPITHLENHFAFPFVNARLIAAISDYNDRLEALGLPRQVLRINDMSLQNGGRFDICADWVAPHGLHREGLSVDVNKRAADGNNIRLKFLTRAMKKQFARKVNEGPIHYEFSR